MSKITAIHARQILDSRGNPTIEVDVFLESGVMGRAAVPSGASTGSKEALELRDGGDAFNGKGVLKAVHCVEYEIQPVLVGMNANDQLVVDSKMQELDGTSNKGRLGANAILGVSLATAKAEANSRQQFFFEYVRELSPLLPNPLMPLPMCNLINGGKHAAGSTDIQEFMVIPVGAKTFSQAVRMVAEVFQALKGVLSLRGYGTTVGDEGGFAPRVKRGNREALELLSAAVENAGYRVGFDIAFAVDIAANELYKDGFYMLKTENKQFTADEMIGYYTNLVKEFPLISIEDGLYEGDWEGWHRLQERLGSETQLVGDDFLVTNSTLLMRAIQEDAANAILVKPNQIGTLSEAIEAVVFAKNANWKTILSHRSGETEDTTIAHLAVGLASGQIKTGSMSRSDRVAKYNELLRIEELLGTDAKLAKWQTL